MGSVKSTVPLVMNLILLTNIYAGISIRMYFFSCSNNNVIDTCSAAGSSDNMYHVNNDIDIDESCSES